MNTSQPLTRDGTEPNRAGRAAVAAAMARLLDAGRAYTDPEAAVEPERLRSWAARLRELAADLADCIEAPVRNRIIKMLSSPSLPDDALALPVLRVNVLGASSRKLGAVCGIAGGTIDRIEAGASCNPSTAKAIADCFALSVLELFDYGAVDGNDALRVRTVAGLREVLVTDGEARMRALADDG